MRPHLTPRPRRLALALAAGALLATTATACEPPPPPAAFTVVPAATGADATPGDGICATAQDTCSLQAAVEEANALDTATDITIPDEPVTAADLWVTGAITLLVEGQTHGLGDVSWTIQEGAQLTVTDTALGPVVVDGTLLFRRGQLGTNSEGPVTGVDALVQVGATGTVLLTNVHAIAIGAPLAINAGVMSIHGTTVTPMDAAAMASITTVTGGQTRISATAFLGGPDATDACAGVAPTSYGYNLAPDTTCGFLMTGDREDFDQSGWLPEVVGDARLDAIPVGTLHCGAGWYDDAVSGDTVVRPTDSGEPGELACDIGARELWGDPS
jgi:hypothetical protein